MKDLSMYTPEICDGDYCPMNCDHCYKKDQVLEWEEAVTQEEQSVSLEDYYDA